MFDREQKQLKVDIPTGKYKHAFSYNRQSQAYKLRSRVVSYAIVALVTHL
jgi:hypothetical protein